MIVTVTSAGIELRLDSARSEHIPNSQGIELTPLHLWQGTSIEEKYAGTAKAVTLAHARYNCHGLVFASRRTCISEPDTVRLILKHDGYNEVAESMALPGDIVIYTSDNGDPEHSGIVVEAAVPSTFNMPKVLSKWGLWKEFVHLSSQCPYEGARHYFRIAP